jgi:hypothetical protein
LTPTFIAEVKTQSPFGFQSKLPWGALLDVAIQFGDIISIHTDSRWGGDFKLITKARRFTKKPILAKGLHTTDDDVKRAVDAGADYVLVVGRTPSFYHDRCWLEPRFLIDLEFYPSGTCLVWNTRDLRDGSKRIESWKEARKRWPGWMCQASNIKSLADVCPKASAFLVGEYMVQVAKEIERRY